MTNTIKKIYAKAIEFLELFISMSGYVVKHATIPRTIIMLVMVLFSVYLSVYQTHNSKLALIYFIIAEIVYLGFIYLVLPKNGYRKWFIKKWGEEKGFLIYETILGVIFFNNGMSIGYFALANSGNLFKYIPKIIPDISVYLIAAIMFVVGYVVKILATKATTIEIYYWKDMFLGRKTCEFVVAGPYKYLNNPMYGLGQLQAYAIAIWYASAWGLLIALINQGLVFLFFYTEEKKFIKRVYTKKS